MYVLLEKYYKPITVQYYIASCISWVCRLTSLGLPTNWTYKHAVVVHMQGIYCKRIQTGKEVKLPLFADDMTLYKLTKKNPEDATRKLLDFINELDKIKGYKINT